MSKKDQIQDLDSSGRLQDGWSYSIFTRAGTFWFADADPISAIQSRWAQALEKDGLLEFTGARGSEEEDDGVNEDPKQTVGPLEGKGFIRASAVIGIRYSSASDDHSGVALEAAKAFYQIQAQAAQELAEDVLDESDDQDQADVDLGTLQVSPTGSQAPIADDEGLDGDVSLSG